MLSSLRRSFTPAVARRVFTSAAPSSSFLRIAPTRFFTMSQFRRSEEAMATQTQSATSSAKPSGAREKGTVKWFDASKG